MSYVAMFERDKDDPSFWNAWIKDDPACMTCAKTLREAMDMIVDAAALWYDKDLAHDDFVHRFNIKGVPPKVIATLAQLDLKQATLVGERDSLRLDVIKKLIKCGLSTRDVGAIVGVTASRVSQIAKSA